MEMRLMEQKELAKFNDTYLLKQMFFTIFINI